MKVEYNTMTNITKNGHPYFFKDLITAKYEVLIVMGEDEQNLIDGEPYQTWAYYGPDTLVCGALLPSDMSNEEYEAAINSSSNSPGIIKETAAFMDKRVYPVKSSDPYEGISVWLLEK